MAFTDDEINEDFLHLENHITISATKRLRELGFDTKNLEKKVHIAMNLVQSYAHEAIYDKHDYIDYSAMKEAVIKALVYMFE
ncbi:MAG: hypothetical protein IK048_02920 [Clostridia bacterium]|nr:hypothetical protein [Clostridia bacterium]